jgi:hypothetical protein
MDEFDNNEIGRLLRLKRYEQPPPGYFREFPARVPSSATRRIAPATALENCARARAGFHDESQCCAHRFLSRRRDGGVAVCGRDLDQGLSDHPGAECRPSLSHCSSPTATEGGWSLAAPVSTRITVSQPRSHLSTHRTATPPRYVLDSMPVSYESSLRF